MSFRLVDKIKKSNLPGPLKKVLEAYVSFGNADGTSIRPTAAHVAKRAGGGKRTVQRHTTTLVRLGVLVHDFNEDGTYKTYNYPKAGVWAYVYHADLSPLANPAITEGFEMKRLAVSKARSKARGTGTRSRQFVLFDDDKMAQTVYDIMAETPCDKMADRPDPIAPSLRSVAVDQTQTDPSVLANGSELVSKSVNIEPSALTTSNLNETHDQVSGALPSQEQPQAQTYWWQELSEHGKEIIEILYPFAVPYAEEIMAKANLEIIFGWLEASVVVEYLRWNRSHKSGGLVIRNLTQLINALRSGYGLNDYYSHEAADCSICKKQAKAKKQQAELSQYCKECGKAGASDNYMGHCGVCWAAINAADAQEIQKIITKNTPGGVLDVIRSGRGFAVEEAE